MRQSLRLAASKNDARDYERAKTLRKTAPLAERALWNAMRLAAKGTGFRFRRQYPIHPYIVDFVCLKAKIVVEVDGFSHDARQKEDARRDTYLHACGFKVMRFANEIVLENADGVALTVMKDIMGTDC
jgi:very-short-patch-repair endonuclease